MEDFRKMMQGWLGKSLLALIILPFAFFGIEGIFSGGGKGKPAIEVNGQEISKAELDQAVENRRQQLLQRMGEGVDPAMISTEMVKPATVKALIQRKLVVEAAKQEGLYVPAGTVKSYVRSLPQFHDEKGVFSQERLERFLAQSGLSTSRIFSEITADMVTEQLQGGISESAFATPKDVERILELDKQTRDIALLQIKPDTFKSEITVSDDELNAYFEKNKEAFRTPEKVQLEYVQFTQSDFVDNAAEVTEEKINSKLQEKAEKAKQDERRRAAHMLVEVGGKHKDEEAKAMADSFLKEVREGKDFAELAKEKSEDFATAKQGGDLGFAGRGIYDPAFEEALFALKKEGDLSGVVKSEFGYHVIKLLGIEQQAVPAADKDRDSVIAEIRKETAKEKMSLAVDDLNRLAFESGDLSVIAEQYKKTISTSDWITRAGAKGVFAQPKVIDVAFSDAVIQEQRNSDAIELDDGSLLMVRLKSHEPPRLQSLEEVKPQMQTNALAEKAKTKALSVAQDILTQLKAGGDLEKVAAETKLTWEINKEVARSSSKINRQVLQKAFEVAKPAEGKNTHDKVELPTGEVIVFAVSNVATKTEERTDAEKQQFAKGLAYRFGSMDFEGFTATLESKAEIVRNDELDETK